MADEIDWLDELEERNEVVLPEDDKVAALAKLGQLYQSTFDMLEEAEAQVAKLEGILKNLREDLIPDKMIEFGIKKITLADGAVLGYAPFYKGRVTDPAGYDWLESEGYPDAVKQEMTLSTSRIDRHVLDQFREFILRIRPENLSVNEKVSIHHMTLSSLIKTLTLQGKQLPRDLFEVYIGNIATLKKGKMDG